MEHHRRFRGDAGDYGGAASGGGGTPGKRTLTMGLPGRASGGEPAAGESRVVDAAPVQRMLDEALRPDLFVHEAAAHGTSGAGGALPYLDTLQPLFGGHDLGGIVAHTDGAAREGAEGMGAQAFATGNHVAFAGTPSLHTVAHEAAHVVQQRGGVQLKGGVGESGDAYEQHADAVADAVVAGRSAAPLLDGLGAGGGGGGAVQRYSVEHGHKVSAARDLAVADASETKRAYAKPSVIERSNAILGALRSRVTLTAGDAAPEALEGMRAIVPGARLVDQAMFNASECVDVADQVTGSNQTHAIYQPQNGGRKTMMRQSPSVIGEINRIVDVLGHTRNVRPSHIVDGMRRVTADDNESELHFDYGGTDVDTDNAGTANNAIKDQLTNRNLRIALLLNTLKGRFGQMPQIQQEIVDRLQVVLEGIAVKPTEDRNEEEIQQWEGVLRGIIADLQTEHGQAYREMDDDERSRRAGNVGVNEFARPDVGESYGVLSSRPTKHDEGNLWSFHFAAVIARDGDDSVTLENYNRRDQEGGDNAWYFDMQGAREQSFHEKHKDTVADGVTLRFGAPASDEDKQELMLLIEARYSASPLLLPFRVRVQRAQTRAELAAIRVDALGT